MTLQNFSWVLPGKLAGSDIPGHHSADHIRTDLEYLAENGIRYLVSLEKPAGEIQQICSELNMTWKYFPIPDFSLPPDITAFSKMVTEIIEKLQNGLPVCVHCHAGVGRTGLVLSCVIGKYFLLDSNKALATVRRSRAAIDTAEQRNFVRYFLEEYEYRI
ncbi:MAG: hypothetical protein GX640_10285 [Fibrobacter sp.]|nr:hypothetical protein [Fibrobacter sp.]